MGTLFAGASVAFSGFSVGFSVGFSAVGSALVGASVGFSVVASVVAFVGGVVVAIVVSFDVLTELEPPDEHPENAAIIASAPMIDNNFAFFIVFPSFFIITVLTMGQ